MMYTYYGIEAYIGRSGWIGNMAAIIGCILGY